MRVIITGAASGIGRALALQLARASAPEPPQLLLVDHDEGNLASVVQDVVSLGGDADSAVVDLTAVDSGELVVAQMEHRFGGVDAIVSNAGGIRGAPLRDLDVEAFDFSFHLNTRPTWLLAKAAHPLLKASRGAIVATASTAGTHPTPPLGTYGASKAALIMLMRQMAVEWGADGIRCNTVSPGPTVTGITQAVYSDPAKRAERAAHIPLGRVGEADDVAAAIAFLIHPSASHITGIDIIVDGGLSAGLMRSTGAGSGDLKGT